LYIFNCGLPRYSFLMRISFLVLN